MNEGVKILLERMKTNPDEFYDKTNGLHVTTRWGRILTDYQSFLEPEDINALKEAMSKLHQEQFTKLVMKELLAPEEDDDMGKWFTKRGSATVSATPIPAISSIMIEQNEQLRAQVNAMKVEVRKKPVLKKPHQTLFGKLFNYS